MMAVVVSPRFCVCRFWTTIRSGRDLSHA